MYNVSTSFIGDFVISYPLRERARLMRNDCAR